MKLYVTPGSPYARMARIVVIERRLESRVEIIAAQTRRAESPYYKIKQYGGIVMPNTVDNLKDIHLPSSIGIWPLAWGWWAIVLLIIMGFIICGIWWKRNRYRIAANRLLKQYYRDYQQSHMSQIYIKRLASLLKQVALTHYGRDQTAHLQGQTWLAFLDEHSKTTDFSRGIGQCLLIAPYCSIEHFETHFSNTNIHELNKLATAWIKRHQ